VKNVDRLFIVTDTVYTAKRDCTILVHAFGASGSGAVVVGQVGTATGGGAGARCTKRVRLKTGEALTITCGVGGAGITAGTATTLVDGNDGGDTTVTGPGGLSIVAGGGKGGKATDSSGGLPLATLGGAGGVASGGDENVTGGRGGNAVAGSAAGYRATGGGALPLFDVGYRGGDVDNPAAGNAFTGGGGIGGRGGDVTGTGSISAATGGGGAFRSAPDVSATGASAGADSSQPVDRVVEWLRSSDNGGGAGVQAVTPTAGSGGVGGGGGAARATNTGNANAGLSAAFGGTGACYVSVGATANLNIASIHSPRIYGGSGGAFAGGAGTVNTAPGGDGFVVLEILP
jgi:hypothetical protein